MAHVTGSLPSTWGIWIEFLASGFSPFSSSTFGCWALKQYMGTLSICFSSVCLDASQISGKNIFFLNRGTKEELAQKTRMQQTGVHAQSGGE